MTSILGLLSMSFHDEVVFFTSHSLLFRLALAIHTELKIQDRTWIELLEKNNTKHIDIQNNIFLFFISFL